MPAVTAARTPMRLSSTMTHLLLSSPISSTAMRYTSGLGFLDLTTSPANTQILEARSSPMRVRTRFPTASSDDVEHTASGGCWKMAAVRWCWEVALGSNLRLRRQRWAAAAAEEHVTMASASVLLKPRGTYYDVGISVGEDGNRVRV
jgi:hypothetical protein